MRSLLIASTLLLVVACDDTKTPEQAEPPKPSSRPVPVQDDAFLVIERLEESGDYQTSQVSPTSTGYEIDEVRQGFYVTAGEKTWKWSTSEEVVESARDCSCDVFGPSCTPGASVVVGALSSFGESKNWKPPIYEQADDFSAWGVRRIDVSSNGRYISVSVCIDATPCGKPPRPLCDNRVLELGDEVKEVPLEAFAKPPPEGLIEGEAKLKKPTTAAGRIVRAAADSGAEPTLAEVRFGADGEIERRWVIPSTQRQPEANWSANTYSIFDTVESPEALEPFRAVPRTVSQATRGDGEWVGWSAGGFE